MKNEENQKNKIVIWGVLEWMVVANELKSSTKLYNEKLHLCAKFSKKIIKSKTFAGRVPSLEKLFTLSSNLLIRSL